MLSTKKVGRKPHQKIRFFSTILLKTRSPKPHTFHLKLFWVCFSRKCYSHLPVHSYTSECRRLDPGEDWNGLESFRMVGWWRLALGKGLKRKEYAIGGEGGRAWRRKKKEENRYHSKRNEEWIGRKEKGMTWRTAKPWLTEASRLRGGGKSHRRPEWKRNQTNEQSRAYIQEDPEMPWNETEMKPLEQNLWFFSPSFPWH